MYALGTVGLFNTGRVNERAAVASAGLSRLSALLCALCDALLKSAPSVRTGLPTLVYFSEDTLFFIEL